MASGPIKVFYGGEEINLEQEVKSSNNVVMLPLKEISNIFGYNVTWDSQTGAIEIRDGSYVITLKIGSKEATVNGQIIQLPVTPKNFNGTTYVPLRFIGEAMEMGVKWDSKKNQVEIEPKYFFDYKDKKLLCVKNGKEIVVAEDIENWSKYKPYLEGVQVRRTKYGSELVDIYFQIEGALLESAGHSFYIKNGKLIDQINQDLYVIVPKSAIRVINDHVVVSDGKTLKIYDDVTGEVERQYDLTKWLKVPEFEPESYSDKYLLGRTENTLHIIDLVNNKVTRVIDLIPQTTEDEEYDFYCVYNFDAPLTATDEALVFKYHSETEGVDKTVTYMIGK